MSTLRLVCELVSEFDRDDLERVQAHVGLCLRRKETFRDLDEVEPRRSPLPPAADTDPAPAPTAEVATDYSKTIPEPRKSER